MTVSKTTYKPLQLTLFGWTPFLLISFFIIKGTLAPSDDIPRFFLFLNDKVIHGLEYFVLCFVSANTFRMSETFFKKKFIVYAVFYSVFLGTLLESLQRYTPDRTPEIADGLCNALGALGAAAFLQIKKVRNAVF